MKSTMNRRDFLSVVGGIGSVAATGTLLGGSRSSYAQGAGSVVKVTHFGGPYAELEKIVAEPFKAAGLGTVQYISSLTPATLGALQANKDNPPFDVVMLSRPAAVRAGNAGLVDKLDMSRIPSVKEFHEKARQPEGFGVPFVIDTVEIMYNKKMVKEPITSWLDLWRPDLDGKIALPSSSIVLPTDLIAVITRALGGVETDKQAVDKTFAKLAELKGRVRTFTSNPVQASTLIERGEVAATPQLGIRVSAVVQKSQDIARSFPKEGVSARPYDLCIVSGSKAKDLAYKYIEFIVSQKIQNDIVNAMWTPVGNANIKIPDSLKDKIFSDYDKLIFLDETYLATVQRDWMTRWERTIQAG